MYLLELIASKSIETEASRQRPHPAKQVGH